MNQSTEIWRFVVKVKSIGLNVGFELNNCELVRHESLRLEGNVVAGQELIEGTTVYATIWAGDDPRAREAHEKGVLGSASVSKDVANVRTFSSENPFQIAGIDIHIPLLQYQFRELQDSLALANASEMTFQFGCVGDPLISSGLAGPKLVLQDENAMLSVINFRIISEYRLAVMQAAKEASACTIKVPVRLISLGRTVGEA
jgi:hypothetical protein